MALVLPPFRVAMTTKIVTCLGDPTVDGRNPAPVEVGSSSHYLQGFFTSQVVVWDFFHQQ